MTPRGELAIQTLRIQLYSFSQVLNGEDLEAFWALIDEFNLAAKGLRGTPPPKTMK